MERARDRWCWLHPALIALVATVLNTAKPVHIDDAAYLQFARQIVESPLDPYGFEAVWDGMARPANEVLAPPVLLYWLALGIWLSPDEPIVWHLLLFPFLLLLCQSLDSLSRRLLRGSPETGTGTPYPVPTERVSRNIEEPVPVSGPPLTGDSAGWHALKGRGDSMDPARPSRTQGVPPAGDPDDRTALDRNGAWLIATFILSPALLPGINLMLDVPALALATGSLALFLASLDRQSFWRAGLAGLLLALGFETKYTAAALLPAWFAAAWTSRGPRRTAMLSLGLATALVLVASWEAWIAHIEGISHLWYHLDHPKLPWMLRLAWAPMHLNFLGAAIPAASVFLIGDLWHRRPTSPVAAFCCWFWGAVGIMAAVAVIGGGNLERAVCGWLAIGVLLATLVRLGTPDHRVLMAYVLSEYAFCLLASPFAAMRRVMGAMVPLWLMAWSAAPPRGRKMICGISIGCGLAFWWLDLHDARAMREAGIDIAARYHADNRTLWFLGDWGWSYYAQRAGMRPFVPLQMSLRPGDLVIVPDRIGGSGSSRAMVEGLASAGWLRPLDPFPLTYDPPPHVPWWLAEYYFGSVPIERRTKPLVLLRIYEAAPN